MKRSTFLLVSAPLLSSCLPTQSPRETPPHLSRKISGLPGANVLTQHNDTLRTGANLAESTLTTGNVGGGQFGRLFTLPVQGRIFSQPLYASGVVMSDGRAHNVLYVATRKNNVYAFDADDPNQTLYWTQNLGPPRPLACLGGGYGVWKDGGGQDIGLTSTPVIDLSTHRIYAVASTYEGPPPTQPGGQCPGTAQMLQCDESGFKHTLFALDIGSGVIAQQTVIEATAPASSADSVDGVVAFRPMRQLQRAALLLSNGVVYVAFAGYGDTRPYHGWIMGYDASTLARMAVFNVTPMIMGGGIWQGGMGLAADEAGDLYGMTGNPMADALEVCASNGDVPNHEGIDFADSFVKLHPTAQGLTAIDWFTPWNASDLASRDADLGSSGVVLLPNNRMLGAGKGAVAYLLDRNNLGKFHADSDHIVQEFPVAVTDFLHHVHGSPVYWNGQIYVWPENTTLRAYRMNPDGTFNPTPVDSGEQDADGMPGGVLSVSSNGDDPASAILWTSRPFDGDATYDTVHGVVEAFAADDVTHKLWQTETDSFAKDVAPTIANGKVYLATFSDEVIVFGLMPASPGATLFTSQVPALGDVSDQPRELGMKFQSSQEGMIASLRYFRAPGETGAHTGRVWSSGGTQLAVATFSNETGSGWQQAVLPNPLPISPNTSYVVSVNANGHYAATNDALATAVVNGPLSSVADGANGVYGSPAAFPTLTYRNTNYFRDVVFTRNVIFTSQVPEGLTFTDGRPYELGMKFQSSQAGRITSVRYYRSPSEGGTHTGRIWSSTGVLLASVAFSNETSFGWQEMSLSSPLAISANTPYTVSVNYNGYYVATNNGLSRSVVNGPLSTLADGANGTYGTPGTFPTSSYLSTNYFRDIVFSP